MEQIHIGLTVLGGIVISWMCQTNLSNPTVNYGLESNLYKYIDSGYCTSYYQTSHCHVLVPGSNLYPGSEYYYRVGDKLTQSWSDEFVFKAPELNKSSISFAVYADLGVVNGDPTIKWLDSIKSQVDLYWHGGDISYADDSFLHPGCAFKFCYEETWDKYMGLIQPFASYKPYMVAPGNHEADCHDPACLTDLDRRTKLSNFTAYNTRFRMPSQESGSTSLNMHYSWDYGLVHFISIDTETGFPGAEEETKYVEPCGGFSQNQLKWLEQDLKAANASRNIRPWIFVQGHHPMYQGDFIDKSFQAAMEKLFYDYSVDVYFSGHIHSYERTWPVYQGIPEPTYTNPRAPMYIMLGGSGNDEMTSATKEKTFNPAPNYKLIKESDVPGPWTVVTDKNHFGAGLVKVINRTHMEFQYIRTSDPSDPYDSVILIKSH
jgi:hypothetical protein